MINGLYNLITQNLIYGGVGVALLFYIFMRDARRVSMSNDKGKMFAWMAMPAILVIGATLLTLAAWNVSAPRLNATITSEPVTNAVALGDGLTKSLDALLAVGGVDLSGMMNTLSTGGGVTLPTGNPVTLPLGSGGAMPSVAPAQQAPSTGNPLILPTVAPTVAPPAAPVQEASVNTVARGGVVQYVVQPGDSMYKIAEKLLGDGSQYADLCAANGLTLWQCGQLRRNQVLKIPYNGTTPPRERPVVAQATTSQQLYARQQQVYNPAVTNKAVVPVATKKATTSYTIRAGDTVYTIAQKAGGVSLVYQICLLNRAVLGDNCDQLTVGATITLP